MDSIDDIINSGFSGGQRIKHFIEQGLGAIPRGKGVYIIARDTTSPPVFINPGTGGYFKGKDPNVSEDELKSKWVDDTCTVYIGKASDLRERLVLYLRFGQGKNVAHWGGRYIWQLEDAKSLHIFWKETAEDPRDVEQAMISEFMRLHGGKRPFANLIS